MRARRRRFSAASAMNAPIPASVPSASHGSETGDSQRCASVQTAATTEAGATTSGNSRSDQSRTGPAGICPVPKRRCPS